MRTRVTLIRLAVLLALIPVGIAAVSSWGKKPPPAPGITAHPENYDPIAFDMSDGRVQELLRCPGVRVEVPGWPRTVGDFPEFRDGCRMKRRIRCWSLPDDLAAYVPPDREVKWVAWGVRGEDRWIAVAFT